MMIKNNFNIKVDKKRNNKLTDFAKSTLKDRYLLKNESYQNLFIRVATVYGDNKNHANRLYNYMSNLWFMPATPILSNGGAKRGLPISCFLNETKDSLFDIVKIWNENVWLASKGGGIGTYWGNVRSIGEKILNSGRTSGIIPFLSVQDRLTLAISQGSLRRGSAAIYIPVDHPEIEEFIEIRKPTGGDPNRKTLNLHHGLVINNHFMNAVEKNDIWHLLSPKDKSTISTVKARSIWIRILLARIETGEPYILFIDNVNNNKSEIYKKHKMNIKTSNLCSEITLTTGKDYLQKDRTAVCCLSSLNLDKFIEWKNNSIFIEDIMKFLDNVLNDFINNAPDSIYKAKYSAQRERSVGLGVMGFHSFLQSINVPIESSTAKAWNLKIFKNIQERVNKASKKLAEERGPCPDALDLNIMERFTHKTAIAPTASISIICGSISPGIEPYNSNSFTQKSLSGSFNILNPYLKKLLQKKGKDNENIWSSIMNNEGSVAHFNFLNKEEKNIFKTAFEINPMWLIELSADRSKFIDQSQSINLFLPYNISKTELNRIHYLAWKNGLKSLYYCRSKSIQRPDKVSINYKQYSQHPKTKAKLKTHIKYDECLSCE